MTENDQSPSGSAVHMAEMLRHPEHFPQVHMRCPVLATSDADDHCYISLAAGIRPASDDRPVLQNAVSFMVMDTEKGAMTKAYHLTAEQCSMLAAQLQIIAQQLRANEASGFNAATLAGQGLGR